MLSEFTTADLESLQKTTFEDKVYFVCSTFLLTKNTHLNAYFMSTSSVPTSVFPIENLKHFPMESYKMLDRKNYVRPLII